jgi:hypothetical protein
MCQGKQAMNSVMVHIRLDHLEIDPHFTPPSLRCIKTKREIISSAADGK